MRDTELYERLLGIVAPWKVEAVEMEVEAKRVVVKVTCEAGIHWADPELGRLQVHGWEERKWRDLDSCSFCTEVHARVPRVIGPEGKTRTVAVPWAERYSRFTKGFEAFAVRVLIAAANVRSACGLLGISWTQAHRIMGRAVERGLACRDLKRLRYLGIDEKSFRRGQDYVTVVCEIEKGRVLEVTPGAGEAPALEAYGALPEEALRGVEAVAMDMSAAYMAATAKVLPLADIVHDRYHVSAMLSEAVDKVRKEENRRLLSEGDQSLKGTKQLWLAGVGKRDALQEECLQSLLEMDLKVGRAWTLREQFRHFWQRSGMARALDHFEAWYKRAVRSRLKPVVAVAKTLKEHLFGLLNYYNHKITNAVAEGLNSRIQSIKSSARGFRSFDNYRTRILFYLGGLDLLPS